MPFSVEQFEKHLELYSPYPTYWVCSDGGVLCDKCVEKEKERIIDAIETNDRGGWKVEGVGQNFEDDSLFCDNCNAQIPSAYGDPDSKDESVNEGIDMAVALGAAAVASKVHTAYIGYQLGKKYLDKKKHDREVAEPNNWPNRFPLGDDDIELVSESDVKQVVAVVDSSGDTEDEESGFSTSGYYVAKMERVKSGVYRIINKSAEKVASWGDAERKAKDTATRSGVPYVGYADHMGGGKFVTESKNESHMQPEVFQSSGWEITNKGGVTWWLPDEFGGDGSPEDLEEYNPDNGAIEDIKNVRGWFARMQSPGYLDSTDWYFAKTEADAMKLLGDYQTGDFEFDESFKVGDKVTGIMGVHGMRRGTVKGYRNDRRPDQSKKHNTVDVTGDDDRGDFDTPEFNLTAGHKRFKESTLALNVGTEPIQPFGDSDGPVLIEPDGTGTFSLVHHDEEDVPSILESGLSIKEASKLINHYNRMFVSGDFKESKNEGRNTMATVSSKRLVEAVARGRNPVQVVSSFLRSRLAEDTDVLQMLSGDDTGGKPLGGADTTNPMPSASTKADVGPSSPIIPSATTAPIDGETGNADLAKKDDEEGVDSAIGSADGSSDSEFMNTSESRLRRKLRVRKRVREALGLTSGEDRPISEERKKRARKARIREAINRIKARRGRRRFNEEEELPDFIKDKIAKGDSEGSSEKDTEKKDGEEGEEDDSEGSEKNFGGGEEKKDDSEKKESYYGAARRNEMKALNNSYQQMTPVGAGRRRGESVNETFRSMMEAEGSEQDNTAKVQDLDKLPTEKDSENKEAPMESRRRSPRFRSRFRRRTVESETVFPPEKLKGEGFIADLTAGAVDDEDKIEKPESIRRRARARIQERQRGRRRNESIFGTRFEIGERVRVKGGGTGVVVEHADSSGTRGFGYQYLVQMDGTARSQRVTAADLSKA